MLRQFFAGFANSPIMVFPLISMALCMTVFLAVLIYVARQQNQEMDRLAKLPLDDEGALP
jgi:mannose/fructose/N-acetylgalactosamine-specific phosphotransferase system component IIC